MTLLLPRWSPLASALSLLILAAIVPAVLCTIELTALRRTVTGINEAATEAKRARHVVEQFGQTVVSFTAMALNLSEDERRSIIQDADTSFHDVKRSFALIENKARRVLDEADYDALKDRIASVDHNWHEVREQAQDGLSDTAKSYHFLKIIDDTTFVRSALSKVEMRAAEAAEAATAASVKQVEAASRFLNVVLTLGSTLSGLAIFCVFSFARQTRRSNQQLKSVNEKLVERDAKLVEQNVRFDAALTNMPHGLCMFDAQQQLVVCNNRYAEMYNLPADLLVRGTPLSAILAFRCSQGNAPLDSERYLNQHAQLESKQATTFKVEILDGRIIRVSHKPMLDGGYVASHEDITDAEESQARIAHMAHHDALTGLPNRVQFRESLDRAIREVGSGESIAVLCLDLDHFKAVNDTLGHPIGDALLRAVAERLRGCVRDTDTVARLGGDEFAIVQTQITEQDAPSLLAKRVIEALSAPYTIEGHQVVIGTSVGLALSPDDSEDANQLIKAADMALYRAKMDGRGTYRFFEPDMDARMQKRRALELDLRKALPNGEFEVYYQPLINLEANRVSGFEALLRWTHPERGRVSPDDFIPLTEEIGLISQIGAWVLRQACADAVRWPTDVRLAVNLSAAQFKSKTLVLDVVSALAQSGLPAHRLELEITETVMLQDTDATLLTLHQLRDLGVRISMDDFGTGYSSLSYLRKFPFDKIKIDQSFIRDLPGGQDAVAIIKAVTGLGTSLGMSTTAEGVETEGQLARLRAEGCTEVQGWLFSPARPANEVMGLLSSVAKQARSAA